MIQNLIFEVYLLISDFLVESLKTNTARKMKFSVKDFFSKCDQTRSFLRIWSHLLEKFSMENFIFCAVKDLSPENVVSIKKLHSFYEPQLTQQLPQHSQKPHLH